MKKIYLFVIITITVLCVIIGSIVHVTGFLVRIGRGAEMFGFGKNAKKVTETLSEGDFSELSVDLDLGNIVIKSGDGNVEWNGSEELKPEVSAENGKLKIKQKDGRLLTGAALNNTLTISVPSALKKLDVKSDMGNLDVSGITAGKTDLKVSAGNITIKDAGLGDLEADANAGDIRFDSLSAEKAEFDSNAGNIKGSVSGSFKSLKADTDLGNIELKLDCARSELTLDLKTDLGNVTVNGEKTGSGKNGSGSSSVKADTDMGNINITTY